MTSRESRSSVASSCVRLAVSADSSARRLLACVTSVSTSSAGTGGTPRGVVSSSEAACGRKSSLRSACSAATAPTFAPARSCSALPTSRMARLTSTSPAAPSLARAWTDAAHPLDQLEPLLGVLDVLACEQRAHVRRLHPGTGLGEGHPLAGPGGGFHRLLHLLEALAALPADSSSCCSTRTTTSPPDAGGTASLWSVRFPAFTLTTGLAGNRMPAPTASASTERRSRRRAGRPDSSLRPGRARRRGRRTGARQGQRRSTAWQPGPRRGAETADRNRDGPPHGMRRIARYPRGPTGPRAYSARQPLEPGARI